MRKSKDRVVARAPDALSAQALAALEPQAAKAAALLRQLANEHRLLLLCHLMLEGEVTVGHLAERLSLSQPALSQHLTRLREDGLVATRREGTTIHYRIADPRVVRLLGLMHEMFCPRL